MVIRGNDVRSSCILWKILLPEHNSASDSRVLRAIQRHRQIPHDVRWYDHQVQSGVYGSHLDSPDSTLHRSIPRPFWKVRLQPRTFHLRAGMVGAGRSHGRKQNRRPDYFSRSAYFGYRVLKLEGLQDSENSADKQSAGWKPWRI